MSERNHAPRSGGRAADPRRETTGRRDGLSRDADAQGDAAARRSAARGVRHFADEETGDTRRSGTAGDRRTGPVRGGGRDAEAGRSGEGVRGRTRKTDGVRAKARDTEGVRAKARDTDGVRAKARDTDGVRARARDTDGVRARAGERDRNTAGSLGRGWNAARGAGSPAGQDRKGAPAARRSRMADALGGRRRADSPVAGRRPTVDAPVDGTAALDIEVTAGEPLRVEDAAATPRLRVAPPAPISAPRAPFVAGVLSLVVVGVLGILVINTKTNENSFRIADLQKQGSVLDNQQQDLENQLVAASSIGNLDAAARRLGMVKAEKMAIIRLPDGKTIGVPTPPNGRVSVTAQDTEADKAATGGQATGNGQTDGGTGQGADATGQADADAGQVADGAGR